MDTNQPSSSPDPSVPPPSQTPQISIAPSQKKLPNILIIVIMMLLLGATGLLAFQNYQLKQQLADSQLVPASPTITGNPSPTLTPTPTLDPTINWKQHTIEELNISFKLPLALSSPGILTRTETPSETGQQICWALDQRQGFRIVKPVLAGGGSCHLDKFTVGVTSADHQAGRMSGFADQKTFTTNPDIPINLIEQFVNSNGVEMVVIQGANGPKQDPMAESGFPISGTPGEGAVGVLIQNDNAVFPVITLQMKLDEDKTQNIFKQILSTFEFTD